MRYMNPIPTAHIKKFHEALGRTILNVDLSHMGYIGILGSSKIKHNLNKARDIDIVIFLKEDKPIGESIIKLEDFYTILDKRLQKDYSLYIAPSSKKNWQIERNYLIGNNCGLENKICVHTLTFFNKDGFEKKNPLVFQQDVKNMSIALYGNLNVLENMPEVPKRKEELYADMLETQIPLLVNKYPSNILIEKTKEIIRSAEHKYSIKILGKIKTVDDCSKAANDIVIAIDEFNGDLPYPNR